jgi:Domain of unknown function (DUF6894)
MPRYFFDLSDSAGLTDDDEGLELRDLDAVQAEAARALGGMVWDAGRIFKGSKAHLMVIDVRDDAGPGMRIRLALEIMRKN